MICHVLIQPAENCCSDASLDLSIRCIILLLSLVCLMLVESKTAFPQEKYTPTVYMHTQIDINCKMRAILIDWIVEVHLKFKLADPTLYLTCHIIDRFCMQENVHRSKLQLVGVTALLIACKYEEIYPTEVRDCVYITDHAYTREEVLEMEQMILRRLKFEISVPTPWTFLVRFLKVAKATDRQHHRAQYYLERCLQEHDGLSYRPSMLAATAVFLARIPDTGLDEAWVSTLLTQSHGASRTRCAAVLCFHDRARACGVVSLVGFTRRQFLLCVLPPLFRHALCNHVAVVVMLVLCTHAGVSCV